MAEASFKVAGPGFGIKHKTTGKWFIGFGPAPGYEVLWGEEVQARHHESEASAEAQIYLLERPPV